MTAKVTDTDAAAERSDRAAHKRVLAYRDQLLRELTGDADADKPLLANLATVERVLSSIERRRGAVVRPVRAKKDDALEQILRGQGKSL